jgi:23S rRNA pseudouridine1911/1915/1917 synthase
MQVEDTINNDELSLYENYRIEVDKGQSLLRIDKFLMARLEGTSRNKIQMAARANCIKVNDNAVRPNYRVKPGDVITLPVGCCHTVIADTDMKIIEVQLGKDISVHDKKKGVISC